MSDSKPYPLKLHHTLRWGKFKDKVFKDIMDSEDGLDWVKWAHKRNLIGFDPESWTYFLDKAKGNEKYKKVTTTLYGRHVKRR